MVSALVFLAPGFEEIETATIVDILRRCGVNVSVAGLVPTTIEGAHGMKFVPDISLEQAALQDFDAVICPGGAPGYTNLRRNQAVLKIVKEAFDSDKVVAAICAGPAVLSDAGILKNKRCTIYPGMERELEKGGGKPLKAFVVEDENIITSQGPSTALMFTFKVAEHLVDKKIVEQIKEKTLAALISN